jgi:hypothetical protein
MFQKIERRRTRIKEEKESASKSGEGFLRGWLGL